MKNSASQKFFLATRSITNLIVFISIFAIALPLKVLAQETPAPGSAPAAPASGSPSAPGGDKTKLAGKGKKTTIDFEDQLIEGSRQKPELFYLLQNKDFNYKRLIRLREDFLPELRKSGEDVQGRSGSAQ